MNTQLMKQNELLLKRIEVLEEKLASQVTVASLVEECIAIAGTSPPESAPEPAPESREVINTLILSDSMMRHVAIDGPSVMKEVIPGAQCDQLFLKFLELEEKYVFRDIVVCVGTNYLSDTSWYTEEIAYEICNFLTALNNRTPTSTKVTFAQILPKRGKYNAKHYLGKINEINGTVDEMLQQEEIGFLDYNSYGDIIPINCFDIICRDGTHLNRYGVQMVGWYINYHLKITNRQY